MDKSIAYHREIIDSAKVYKRMSQTGDEVYKLHIGIPIVWRPEQVLYNPNVIASYELSGAPLGTLSHFERFLAVKE